MILLVLNPLIFQFSGGGSSTEYKTNRQNSRPQAYSSSSSSASDDILDDGFDSEEEEEEEEPAMTEASPTTKTSVPATNAGSAGSGDKKKNKILLNCFAPTISSLDGEIDIPAADKSSQ